MTSEGSGDSQARELLSGVSRGLAAAVAAAGAATVRVEARRRHGASGVLWSADGLVLTADHVIEREEDLMVGLADGSELPASIVGRDAGSDLALLKVAGNGLPAAETQDDPIGVGHLVLALGRVGGAGLTATLGIVSALGGPWRSRSGGLVEGYIRTDVTMYPGYSGGPLIDVAGRVVGMNSSWLAQGMSMAIPMAAARRIVDELQRRGHVRQAYLGVRTQQVTLPRSIAEQVGQDSGLLLVGVETGGPAELSGLLLGDILVALAGQAIRDVDELQAQLGAERAGTKISAVVVRGGRRQELSVTVGERR